MKAAVLHEFDEKLTAKEFVKFDDVTDPKISRPMDVIVRIGGAGVCRTDLHIVEGIWRSKVDVKLPYIMGHENAGWVEAIGPGVEGIKVGDSVICHLLVTSGHCLACRRGDDMHALDSSFPGINANGGYAQYLLTGTALPDQAAEVARTEGCCSLHRCRADRLIAPRRRHPVICCPANMSR